MGSSSLHSHDYADVVVRSFSKRERRIRERQSDYQCISPTNRPVNIRPSFAYSLLLHLRVFAFVVPLPLTTRIYGRCLSNPL